jgi:hypothetical protein
MLSKNSSLNIIMLEDENKNNPPNNEQNESEEQKDQPNKDQRMEDQDQDQGNENPSNEKEPLPSAEQLMFKVYQKLQSKKEIHIVPKNSSTMIYACTFNKKYETFPKGLKIHNNQYIYFNTKLENFINNIYLNHFKQYRNIALIKDTLHDTGYGVFRKDISRLNDKIYIYTLLLTDKDAINILDHVYKHSDKTTTFDIVSSKFQLLKDITPNKIDDYTIHQFLMKVSDVKHIYMMNEKSDEILRVIE